MQALILIVALFAADKFKIDRKLPDVDYKKTTPVVIPDDDKPPVSACQCGCGRQNCHCGMAAKSNAKPTPASPPKVAAEVRRTQCLVFTAPWCTYCISALNDFVAWLKRSGWEVGESPTAHFRLVDFDKNPDLVKTHGITSLPAFVFTVDGNVVSKRTGYPGKESLAQEFLSASKNFATEAKR